MWDQTYRFEKHKYVHKVIVHKVITHAEKLQIQDLKVQDRMEHLLDYVIIRSLNAKSGQKFIAFMNVLKIVKIRLWIVWHLIRHVICSNSCVTNSDIDQNT